MKVFSIVLLLASVLLPVEAMACRCRPLEFQHPMQDHDVVFTGVVLEIQHGTPVGTTDRVLLQVTRNYKSAPEDEIVVYTTRSECDVPFDTNREYLVVANYSAGPVSTLMSFFRVPNALNVSRCGYTTALHPDSTELKRREVMELLDSLE